MNTKAMGAAPDSHSKRLLECSGRGDCMHEHLHFGSADYYLMCADCGARWVRTKMHTDEPDSYLQNPKLTSGDYRIKQYVCADELRDIFTPKEGK